MPTQRPGLSPAGGTEWGIVQLRVGPDVLGGNLEATSNWNGVDSSKFGRATLWNASSKTLETPNSQVKFILSLSF